MALKKVVTSNELTGYSVYVGELPKFNTELNVQLREMLKKVITLNNETIADDFYTINVDKYWHALASGSAQLCYISKADEVTAIAVFQSAPIPFNTSVGHVLQCSLLYGEDTGAVDLIPPALAKFAEMNNITRLMFTTHRKGLLRRFDGDSQENATLYRIMYNTSYYNTAEYSEFNSEYPLQLA